jgi:hypothetical protein
MIPVLIILAVIGGVLTFIYYQKYSKLKKGLKFYEDIGTDRFGFYKIDSGKNYSSYVYIKEIDRYTNGYSKIKLDNIEPFNKTYNNEAIEWARKNFLSLMKTTDIEWLESEDYIRKVRKEKLENLKKV